LIETFPFPGSFFFFWRGAFSPDVGRYNPVLPPPGSLDFSSRTPPYQGSFPNVVPRCCLSRIHTPFSTVRSLLMPGLSPSRVLPRAFLPTNVKILLVRGTVFGRFISGVPVSTLVPSGRSRLSPAPTLIFPEGHPPPVSSSRKGQFVEPGSFLSNDAVLLF